jgi:hypothetical protein
VQLRPVPHRESARRRLLKTRKAVAETREHVERSHVAIKQSQKLLADLRRLKMWLYAQQTSNRDNYL